MGFAVYRNAAATRFVADFATIEEATAALRSGYLLVLPFDYAPLAPLAIDVDGITLRVEAPGLAIAPGAGVTRLGLQGPGAATVSTLGAAIRITAGDGALTLHGGAGADVATGGGADDLLQGGAGNDVLSGDGGDDILLSGTGRDKLYGGDGDDILVGGDARDTLTGGAGADDFVVDMGATGVVILADLDPSQGDRIVLAGAGGPRDLAGLLATGAIRQVDGAAMITHGGMTLRVVGVTVADLTEAVLDFAIDGDRLAFADVGALMASGLSPFATEATIDGTVWKLRVAEPLHENYKAQDDQGRWWSPDPYVVVAAGQSNMAGGAAGGSFAMSPDVLAWDWVNGCVVVADYASASAGGLGVHTGAGLRNNLYFPFANRIAEEMGRPVLVIAHPVSGSRIDSWLADRGGANWAALDGDIRAALGATGLGGIDAFLWLQGESDYPVPTATFRALVEGFVAQVRAQDWSPDDLPILIGELSRLGVNFAQNAAFQAMELAALDPLLGFVGTVGLTAADASGVHFDGASLVELGHERFWAALQELLDPAPPPANAAPTVTVDAGTPPAVTLMEGETLRLDLTPWFADADGDALWYFGHLTKRGVLMTGSWEDGVTLAPDYLSAGSYTLRAWASDGRLDGPSIDIAVTVLDRLPGVDVYASRDFAIRMDSAATLADAQVGLTQNRGLDILSQEALGNGDILLALDSLTLRGAAGLTGCFVMGEGTTRVYLAGAAAFDVRGNALDDAIEGNAGANRIDGLDGRDRLYGGAGDDRLGGGAGADTLYGGDGRDVLAGGSGEDHAWGGAGADSFVFEAGGGILRARDFVLGEDRIEIAGFAGIHDYEDLMAAARLSQSTDRLIMDLGSDRLMISAMTAGGLSADLFVFA